MSEENQAREDDNQKNSDLKSSFIFFLLSFCSCLFPFSSIPFGFNFVVMGLCSYIHPSLTSRFNRIILFPHCYLV
ncbi:hypothetical protein Hanom_Chr04g00319191 [Helianthus anomalus]